MPGNGLHDKRGLKCERVARARERGGDAQIGTRVCFRASCVNRGFEKAKKKWVTGGQACPGLLTWVKYVNCILEQLFAVVRDYLVNIHSYKNCSFHNFICNAYYGLNFFFALNYLGPNQSELHVRPYTKHTGPPSPPMCLPSPTKAGRKRSIPCFTGLE